MDGFRLIDQGRKKLANPDTKKEGLADIAKGNLLLFKQEQDKSATPGFERFRKAVDVATNLGIMVLPNKLMRQAASGLGLHTAFSTDYPGKSWAPFADRWAWLEQVSWPAYYQLFSQQRADLDKAVQRAIDGKAE